jgi:hypothetical protein
MSSLAASSADAAQSARIRSGSPDLRGPLRTPFFRNALSDLVEHLRGVREERKAVMAITDG